ncbi:unnamed protein product [Brachionus calyciflorus]|uniref:G-protein coupled receptors family 1 profile domain-containing protein n=1 Tax=Brachionus calyciflorus TaxID=104777 RepID=A0A814DJK0_9BILA|nr:unnamed protein product [Brachionus calyciflorus]
MSDKINLFEFYTIPTCFVIGLIGNTFGSICLLSNRRLRERTPLFLLAIIGIFDTILLTSQLQRWMATFFNEKIFLVTHSLCKVYFMILRSSILISSALTSILILIRFVGLFFGHYKLSTYSNLGQMSSRLCVAYIISISISLTWHELWTSGLKNGDEPIVELESDDPKYMSTNSTEIEYDNLRCFKNVMNYEIVNMINRIYFFILFLIFLNLAIVPFILLSKIRKNNKLKNLNFLNLGHENLRKNHKSYSLPTIGLSTSYKQSVIVLDEDGKRKTFSISEINSEQNGKETDPLNPKYKKPRKKFSLCVCFISFLTGVFCLPYAILDIGLYEHAQTNNRILNTTFSEFSIDTLRLPLILINIPHCIKFYLLFIFYSKFRNQMSKLLKIKFYINFYMIKDQFKEKSPRGEIRSRLFKFVIMNNFRMFKLRRLSSSSQSVFGDSNEEDKKLNKIFMEFKGDEKEERNCSETSSVCGYNVSTNINRTTSNQIGNFLEAYELDFNLIPTASNQIY